MKRILARLCLLALVLSSSASATPQLPSGLGGVFKKKPKEQPAQPAQTDADKKKAEDDKKKEEEKKPLFSDDSATAKQKKDTTAMGFSGLNPDGTVENAVLNASPSAEDAAAAVAMSESSVAPADLKQFLTDGNLKSKGGQ
ncbi:MAG: hypothetical protein M3P27_09130 [Acidobacteriota bacterium]|nr:hypothetical protein [Acidobacteriota bacterium]